MIAYKVVRERYTVFRGCYDTRYMSARISGASPACRTYAIGETTERAPGHGPLAVFDTEERARAFAGPARSYVVLRCEIEESQDTYLWISPGAQMYPFELPAGTILADRVTPLEVLP